MKTRSKWSLAPGLGILVLAVAAFMPRSGSAAEPAGDKVPLDLNLPARAFIGTPKDVPLSDYVEPLSDQPRPPMMVPSGLKNLAPGAKLSASDTNANPETLQKVVDGDKEASDQCIIFLRKGAQHVQLDLGAPAELFAIAVWHAHNSGKVYQDVIVRVADDAEFKTNVRILFNNDRDNTSGLGAGTHREYFETHEGKLIDAKGARARYVRFHSKGSTESPLNEYTEVEVYGRPAK